ncbi:hypothetical protein [Streptomyces sp. cg36]|uniref:hypothetical protein n=1 Tax=Streptomyces sp. cg36 TaxID=3238798 RepID=UPI0034E2F4FC
MEEAAIEEGALYVLTAILLTPAQFPSVLGDDFPEACAALGLEPYLDGYGMILGQDGHGARWTVIVDDASLVAVAIASWDCGMEYDLSPNERTVVATLAGWPLELVVAAPGVPAPHDPEPEPDENGAVRPPLTPPDTDVWGSAQRRLGADQVALQWATWRAQLADAGPDSPEPTPDSGSGPGSGPSPEPEPTAPAGSRASNDTSEPDDTGAATDQAAPPTSTDTAPDTSSTTAAPTPGTDPGPSPALAELDARVEQVLDDVRQYLDSPPPLGRVRSSFAPGGARMLRADGPGWSIVARTDDIAFVLLDDEPGEVVPVGRGPRLPELLAALDKMAVRPN